MNKKVQLINSHHGGFIMLGTALAIFLILSFFSIFLIRFIINENTVSSYNLFDVRTRNLSISGLEHGIQLFKESGLVDQGPIEKTLGNGNYIISFDQSLNQGGTSLPYSHFTMLKSTATMYDATRNTRVFLSSYPDAFNLSYFGESSTFSQTSSNFNGDIYSNGNLNGISISGTAYTSSGSGATIHPAPPPEFPNQNNSYFQTLISQVPVDSSGGGEQEEEEEESFPGWPVLFTNCNQTGNIGPSLSQFTNAYVGTTLESHLSPTNFTINNGIQEWTVPTSGNYMIEAYGASGNNGGSNAGNASGGNGAYVNGTFALSSGDKIKILVGQQGGSHGQYGGGGGGGTFVIRNNNTILIIAGGGGGGGGTNANSSIHGSCSQDGEDGFNGTYGYGGTNGGGGHRSSVYGGAGGGYSGDGSGNYNHYGERGRSFLNGGAGGGANYGGRGGFGGGAGGYGGGGGGGGYSGGGGGGNGSPWGAGGGGGSFNSDNSGTCTSGYNNGHGRVVIGPPGSFEPGSVTGNTGGGGVVAPEGVLAFTNCNTTGNSGPSPSNVIGAYTGTDLQGAVSIVSNGIQKWKIPETGTYTIEVAGASGGNGGGSAGNIQGGSGAKIIGTFTFTENNYLYILVGQEGSNHGTYGGGGGGGTYVAYGNATSTFNNASPIIIAGGGGGGGHNGGTIIDGNSGRSGSNGGNATYSNYAGPGTGGSNGGGGYGSTYGGNAGGFYGNGSGAYNNFGENGTGFRGGGTGGNANYGGRGGYGGGAGGYGGAGGGGGYSGGGGGAWSQGGAGGGGGSFNDGTNQSNTSGVNSGHGYVWITPPEQPEEPTLPTSYTETGTINLNSSVNTYGANVTFDGATVYGPGKIISSSDITITNSSNIGGGIEIISGGAVLIRNSILGNGVNNLSNCVVIYGTSGLKIEENSTVNGLSIIFDGETNVDNSTYYGAIYNSGTNCEILGSSVNGSIVSSSGLNVISSTISKGNLPPIFGKPYGLEGDVVNGSYLEF